MTNTETDAKADAATEPGDDPTSDASGAVTGEETEAPPSGGPPTEPPELEAAPDPEREALWTRAILPLGLPLLAAAVMAIWVINLSRTFLAGGNQGALIIVMIVTFAIMAGAAMMSAATRMRAASKVMIVATTLVVVMAAGLISLPETHGEDGEGEPTGFQEPAGDPVATLPVVAGPGLDFDQDAYTLPTSGIIEFEYLNEGAAHTLTIDDPQFAGFLLEVPPTDRGKVEISSGTYTIYCTLPGHRAGGMEATLTVQ